MRALLVVLALLFAVPTFAQVTADEMIQAGIDELQAEKDALNDKKAEVAALKQENDDKIAAIQTVADRPGIGDKAKAHCESMIKEMSSRRYPSTAKIDARIAEIDATITELQAELGQ